MLERQSQGPQCTACGSPMRLSAIEPGGTGQDLRTFICPICKRVQTHRMESMVTEAWLEPQLAIKDRRQVPLTHEVHGGRPVPKKPRWTG